MTTSTLVHVPESQAMNRPGNLRNPSFQWRVALVGLVIAVPGGLMGLMLSLFLGESDTCLFAGALLGLVLGAWLEAWPPDGSQAEEEADEQDAHEKW